MEGIKLSHLNVSVVFLKQQDILPQAFCILRNMSFALSVVNCKMGEKCVMFMYMLY